MTCTPVIGVPPSRPRSVAETVIDGGDRIERIVPSDPVDDIARGRALAQAILADIRFEHHDEPIGLIVGKRSKQHRVDEREERGRRRDAKSEEE